MQKLTPEGQKFVNDLASRYNLSTETIIYMIGAVNNGGGTMAQFSSSELGGSGQWMKGGMTMVGDMFNNGLKMTVDNLCSEISNALATMQIFPAATPGTPSSNQWWPTDLGTPFSSGSQNNIRYAVFPKRLAVEINGQVSVYDTLDNNISGVSQQQGGDSSLTFSSQYGTISVSTLPIISGPGTMQPVAQTNFAEPIQNNLVHNDFVEPVQNNFSNQAPLVAETNNQQTQSANTIIELIEKLSHLRDAGALSADEFNAKKTELLNRL